MFHFVDRYGNLYQIKDTHTSGKIDQMIKPKNTRKYNNKHDNSKNCPCEPKRRRKKTQPPHLSIITVSLSFIQPSRLDIVQRLSECLWNESLGRVGGYFPQHLIEFQWSNALFYECENSIPYQFYTNSTATLIDTHTKYANSAGQVNWCRIQRCNIK